LGSSVNFDTNGSYWQPRDFSPAAPPRRLSKTQGGKHPQGAGTCSVVPGPLRNLSGVPQLVRTQAIWAEGRLHIVIMGCGRVGSTRPHPRGRGRSVAIIDQNGGVPASRRHFSGRRVTASASTDTLLGSGISRRQPCRGEQRRQLQHHHRAGSQETSSRERRCSHQGSARARRVISGSEFPVATFRGPPTRWCGGAARGSEPLWRDATGDDQLAEVHVADGWIGHPLRDLGRRPAPELRSRGRLGAGFVPREDTVIKKAISFVPAMRSPILPGGSVFGGPEEH
jgi:trk system potassium uptake protein TrkA